MKKYFIVFFIGILNMQNANAQFVEYAKPILDTLCSPNMFGRGYINNGVNIAANYLAYKFEEIGLKKINSSYFQNYNFTIHTINKTNCSLDDKKIQAGNTYLVDPSCPNISGTYTILPFQINNIEDKKLLFIKLKQTIKPNEILLLKNVDDGKIVKNFIDTLDSLQIKLPIILRSTSKKLLWTTSQKEAKVGILTFPDSIINLADKIDLNIQSKLINNFECKNIVGFIPSKKKKNTDYIVLTAHYDHLGMLGENAYFPGASDNASGTSMILNLANYFSNHKIDANILFILFSGEEVGLLGSKYFVEHPLIDLHKIKMLINIDIMGCAEGGITVVNGETFKQQFDDLVSINNNKKYLPEIKIRGKTANSDHYFFSEAGVPSFFIYSNGGVGYYHDVWDKPNTINLKNYDNVAKLLIDFIKSR